MNKTATLGGALYWILSFTVVALAFRWIPRGVEVSIPSVAYQLVDNKVPLYTHMTVSAVAMALIPFQLWTRLRTARPRLHRYMGRVCFAAILLGGISVVPLALSMHIPAWGQYGFILGGAMWVCSAIIAVKFARQRNFRRHRWWMLVTAALIFTSVTLRVVFPMFRQLGYSFEIAYALVGWSSWMINLGALSAWHYRHRVQQFLSLGANS